MPLHNLTSAGSRPPRIARAAILAGCITAGVFTIVTADGQSAPDFPTPAPSQPTVSRYHDLEANKANSMRALGLAKMRDTLPCPHEDLQANKARSQLVR